ncbi:large-conductance mechanosensitive channel protein MscL [Rhodohalobacter mucosus]|uniref:Large-conductance mechanosensitive channel n=1 Tax=Rhodohalobacter mucosus TaxID=2079485 RepID=A0A316TZU8_9BACT|nr:large-conductance mechanosensitive channel protein MscL [Rhodohalobacter mucosus]PWN05756.1 large conductance mechanosensitive channel protein MscL [Rhodohalobacter mucosus]
MTFFEEFKKFAMRGNVLDLAVAVVVGAAFGRIITSLVDDVIMPPIGLLLAGIDFSEFRITLQEATAGAAAVTINYGVFVQQIVNFLIVAFAIFVVIKTFEKMKRKEDEKPAEPAQPPAQEVLLTEIRDLLKDKS